MKQYGIKYTKNQRVYDNWKIKNSLTIKATRFPQEKKSQFANVV